MKKYWCYSKASTPKDGDDEALVWFIEVSNVTWDILPRASFYGEGAIYFGWLCLHFGRM